MKAPPSRVIAVIGGILIVIAIGVFSLQLTRTKEGPDSEIPLREGIAALKAGEYARAWQLIGPFADAGNTLAQGLVGDMYAFGYGVPADDRVAALWYRRAECHCTDSGKTEYYTAMSYLKGEGVKPNKDLAARWLQRSADAGYGPAQQYLSDAGKLARDGLVVPEAITAYWRQAISAQGQWNMPEK